MVFCSYVFVRNVLVKICLYFAARNLAVFYIQIDMHTLVLKDNSAFFWMKIITN